MLKQCANFSANIIYAWKSRPKIKHNIKIVCGILLLVVLSELSIFGWAWIFSLSTNTKPFSLMSLLAYTFSKGVLRASTSPVMNWVFINTLVILLFLTIIFITNSSVYLFKVIIHSYNRNIHPIIQRYTMDVKDALITKELNHHN